ncbi:UPF0702 transmembrane protein YrbG [Insulibacter thermoxylanivorax]|uniref:UPF0702 transmembrane protein YrbG n=1 Tax=Insulibacter thermoxylanivorax TaxID=2749268 RepID=A0A916QFW0_9BACL|nr:DUF421 domain-containing protein [Insulibacter thermoxylanivorax]GFR38894.1 UPF0702 transmembrane protein YrbG [Insulibacter thermoxylanivorax]
MELTTIFLRTLLMYFLVFLALRLMGKREIGKLSVFDLVNSIMIAELAVLTIEDTNTEIIKGILPMAVLVGIQIILAFISLKNEKLRRTFDGLPSVLVENGEIRDQEMRRLRYTLDDLLLQLRENKIYNPADVEFAVLETTGKLTAFDKKSMGKEGSQQLPRVNIRYEGLPLPLIMDGKVLDENLEKIGQNRFWLREQIRKRGIKDFKSIFLLTIDHKGQLYIDKKDTKES